MVELFETTGILSIGSRLRLLTEMISSDATEIYKLYGLEIKPKWFPVIYMLLNGKDNSVTGIAKAIGQTHPSVSIIVREMSAAGLVTYEKADNDRRATIVNLTPEGLRLRARIERACTDVKAAVTKIENKAGHSRLWEAITHWESELETKSLLERVTEEKESHHSHKVEIVEYNSSYLSTFKRLNIMWINSYWSLESHDLEVLNDPDTSIISKGGHILVALVDEKPMGVVALCPMDNPEYDYEIAKLAVDPETRGCGVGDAIFSAVLEKAKSLGAKNLFLESNTLLKPAISLYRKYGFKELKEYHPAYARGDIQMELSL